LDGRPGRARERALLEPPGQVGGVGLAVDHGAGHTEAGGPEFGLRPVARQKGFEDGLEAGVLAASKLLLAHGAHSPRHALEETEQGLRAAEITGEDHPLVTGVRTSFAAAPASTIQVSVPAEGFTPWAGSRSRSSGPSSTSARMALFSAPVVTKTRLAARLSSG